MLDDKTASVMLGKTDGAFTLALLRTSPDCIKMLNLEGRITFMSENGLCVMEIAKGEDVAGKFWWDLWPEDQRDALRTAFRRAIDGQISMYSGRCPTMAGAMKDWDVRISPVLDDEGDVTSVLAISRDVTHF